MFIESMKKKNTLEQDSILPGIYDKPEYDANTAKYFSVELYVITKNKKETKKKYFFKPVIIETQEEVARYVIWSKSIQRTRRDLELIYPPEEDFVIEVRNEITFNKNEKHYLSTHGEDLSDSIWFFYSDDTGGEVKLEDLPEIIIVHSAEFLIKQEYLKEKLENLRDMSEFYEGRKSLTTLWN